MEKEREKTVFGGGECMCSHMLSAAGRPLGTLQMTGGRGE